jgi:hypothetical protein
MSQDIDYMTNYHLIVRLVGIRTGNDIKKMLK